AAKIDHSAQVSDHNRPLGHRLRQQSRICAGAGRLASLLLTTASSGASPGSEPGIDGVLRPSCGGGSPGGLEARAPPLLLYPLTATRRCLPRRESSSNVFVAS